MNWGRYLAFINMGVNLCAALGYLLTGDYRRAIYWTSAAVLTATVTF